MNEDCLKLTTYFGERKRSGGHLVAAALLDLYGRHEIATSVLLRGMEGFGLKHHLRTDSSLSLSEDLPAVAIAVDTRSRIEAVLDEAAEISGSGLVTLERARMLTDDLASVALPEELHEATKLTIHVGRQDRINQLPAYVAVCDLLRRRGVSGASALLGVDGTVHGRRERARFFARNAAVPVMVIAVGSGERIAAALPELASLLDQPLVTLERVRVCKRDGVLLEKPHALPGVDEHGLALWQKLTIFTSESQLHHGRPIHRAITRKLRQSGASGATTLRGVWGFHGDHAPHGDRLFQVGRHVPIVTIVIDTPERVAESFAIVDELTGEHGLVTSEMVPAMRTGGGGEGRGGLRLARHRF
jgi:PII-like signaling protein